MEKLNIFLFSHFLISEYRIRFCVGHINVFDRLDFISIKWKELKLTKTLVSFIILCKNNWKNCDEDVQPKLLKILPIRIQYYWSIIDTSIVWHFLLVRLIEFCCISIYSLKLISMFYILSLVFFFHFLFFLLQTKKN